VKFNGGVFLFGMISAFGFSSLFNHGGRSEPACGRQGRNGRGGFTLLIL
jgi:hypothetical protein